MIRHKPGDGVTVVPPPLPYWGMRDGRRRVGVGGGSFHPEIQWDGVFQDTGNPNSRESGGGRKGTNERCSRGAEATAVAEGWRVRPFRGTTASNTKEKYPSAPGLGGLLWFYVGGLRVPAAACYSGWVYIYLPLCVHHLSTCVWGYSCVGVGQKTFCEFLSSCRTFSFIRVGLQKGKGCFSERTTER